MYSQECSKCILALRDVLWSLFPWFLLVLLFLAGRDDQVSEGVSDLFPGLFVGHDGVARNSSSSASAALFGCLLFEKSGTDLLVEHPDDRLDYVRLVFPGRRVDIPLEVHLDRDPEASVSDVVVGTAVASTDDVVWSGFIDNSDIVVIVIVDVVIVVVVIAGDRIDVDIVDHAVVLVEARSIKIIAVHNTGGSVDEVSSRRLDRCCAVLADHAAVANRYSSRRGKVGHRWCHRRHHSIVRSFRRRTHAGVVGKLLRICGWFENVLVDGGRIESARGGWIFKRDSHVHGSGGSVINKVGILVGRQFDGVKCTEGVRARGSSHYQIVGHGVLEDLTRWC